MTTQLKNVQFLKAGFCSQFSFLTGQRSWKWERFYAVFIFFEHPQHGRCLIDTGYSEHFYPATRKFPERLFRLLLPTRISQKNNAASELRRAGIEPESIDKIFITHFHIDHIGGLRCFPKATFLYRDSAYQSLMSCTRNEQVHQGFLKSLLPNDFEQRVVPLPEFDEKPSFETLNGLKTVDYWGDGSLQLAELPGHAVGHFGVILNSSAQNYFYVVDACWNMAVLREGRDLPKVTRDAQYDYQAYQQTQESLRGLADDYLMLACHCPETLHHVANHED